MPLVINDSDQDHIVARQERYIEAWRSGSPERIMEFMHSEDFTYSNFSRDQHSLSRSDLLYEYGNTFSNFHDLEIKTRSLHGHKHFTAWEWTITCKHAVGADGGKLGKGEAVPKRVVGCTLMWWDDSDRIVRNHQYAQVKEVEENA